METWVGHIAEIMFHEQLEILLQHKHWKPPEYCMYFKDFNVQC